MRVVELSDAGFGVAVEEDKQALTWSKEVHVVTSILDTPDPTDARTLDLTLHFTAATRTQPR